MVTGEAHDTRLPGLADKVAIVTGGASGMGLETAELLAAAGSKVVIADWNEASAHEACRRIPASLAVHVDVTDEAAVKELVARATEHYGTVDILINNAGIAYNGKGNYAMAPVVQSTVQNWNAVTAVNLTSVALCCKHVLPIMDQNGGGVVVNNASMNGLVGFAGADAYSAAKGGVVALTRALAIDWGPRKVRVNCVCPGAVLTPMSESFSRTPAQRAQQEANVPLGRIGSPREVATVIAFLASDLASYVHGAIIPVDGGWTAR